MDRIKAIIITVAVTVVVGASTGCEKLNSKSISYTTTVSNLRSMALESDEIITSSDEAKKLLAEGNKRYVTNKLEPKDLTAKKRIELVQKGQHPFAVIVSCSDSRVPPEIVFDQALGDIFVVRNAGNVIDDVALGSVEYGAEHLKTPLIVVLGHEKCGAVIATVDGGEVEGSISSIIKRIEPSYEKVKSANNNMSKDELYDETVDENIKNSISEIKKSPIIKELEKKKMIKVIGAKYNMESGIVTFME